MKRAPLVLLLFCVLPLTPGCSAIPGKDPSATGRAVHPRGPGRVVTAEVRPEVRRQALLLYHILVGEIAGHRGDLGQSVKNYLAAARASDVPAVAQRATQIALFARDYAGAAIAARRWVTLQPDSGDAHRTLAILYLREGKLKSSAAQFGRVLELYKEKREQGFFVIGRMLARERDHAAALKVMALLVDRHKSDPYALYAYGHLAAQFKNPALALATVERALKIKPGWPEASLLRARILMGQGKTDQALASMEAVVKANPDSRALRISYGRLLAGAQRFDQAMQQFEALLRKKPKDSELLYAVALLGMEGKRYDVAERYFKRLLETGKRASDAYYFLGAIAETRKHDQQAIKWYAEVRSGARHIDAHIRRSMLIAKGGDLVKARKELYKVRPNSEAVAVRFFIAEADMLREAGRNRDALGVIDKALAQIPGDHDLLYARAMLAEKLNRLDMLEADLKQILAADPDNAHALNALGYTLADRTNRYREALGYIEKALRLSPDHPAILDSMGWVQYRLGNLDQALKYLQRAYGLERDGEIAAHLGEVLWVSGNRAAAREVWARALKQAPKNEVLRAVMKRFKVR